MRRPFIASVILLATITACGPAESSDRTKLTGAVSSASDSVPVFVDIARLAGVSASVVDSILGEPSSISHIANEPEKMPGEYRDYVLPNSTDPMTIRFYRDRAVFFTIYLPFSVHEPEDALARVGLSATDLVHTQTAPAAKWWSGGPFIKVGAITFTDGYNMVQAEAR